MLDENINADEDNEQALSLPFRGRGGDADEDNEQALSLPFRGRGGGADEDNEQALSLPFRGLGGDADEDNEPAPSSPFRGRGGHRLEVPLLGGGGGVSGGGTVIIIVGPTASGKTALSLKLAQQLNTAIISADSRQCFRELNIGVAKPTHDELQRVKHYFINSHSIYDVVNAQIFEQYALNAAAEIFARNKYAVMVGGTGLYIKAFCEGLDEIPEVEEKIRQDIINNYKINGLAWLQQQVQVNDPEFWAVAEQQNPQRLMRALETKMATGKSVLHFRKSQPVKRPFAIVKIGISQPRHVLYNNINARVDEMVRSGLVEEARAMLPHREVNALQTVGYKELFNFFDGTCTLSQAIEQIKLHTRHYAKRQLTWFQKDGTINWMAAVDVNLDSCWHHPGN